MANAGYSGNALEKNRKRSCTPEKKGHDPVVLCIKQLIEWRNVERLALVA